MKSAWGALVTLALAACNSSPASSSSPASPEASAAGASRPVLSALRPAHPPPSTLLPEGAPAPAVVATTHDGKPFDLGALRGRPVVVYFYPKDDTPGCTVEAEGVRDEWPELEKTGAVVVGVSTDDASSHQAFVEKYRLPFALLPDTDHRVAEAFGVPINLGKAKRVTFIIDKAGRIAKVYPAVTPQGHAKELVTALNAL